MDVIQLFILSLGFLAAIGLVAAALAGKAGGGKVACIVSGGNIDAAKLAVILQGGVP